MRLKEEHKIILRLWGYSEEDITQIEEATRKTTFSYKNGVLTCKEAVKLLGIETFLSGISRSAFHWTAVRYAEGDSEGVYFDSSKLFE